MNMRLVMRRVLRSLLPVAALAGMLAVSGGNNACSVFIGADAHQCETTADCARFAGTVCSDRHVCVLGETACLTNSQCIDRYGAETYYCKKDLLPAEGDKPIRRAEAGTCAPLLGPGCQQVLADPGDLRNDEAVVLGVYFMPSWFPLLKGGVDSAELARRDFKSIAGGLPGIRGGKPRPAVFVACDVPFGEQGKNREVTDHLINTVGVPASLGPIIGDWMSYFLARATELSSTTTAGGPAFLTTGNKFPGFENIPGTAGLFFSIGIPADGRGKAYAQVLAKSEADLRAGGFTGNAKVAFIGPGTATYFVVSQGVRAAGRFNEGKTVAENESAGDFKEFAWGDTSLLTDPLYIKASNDLVAYKPNIVICDGGTPCADLPRVLEQAGQTNVHYVLGQEGQQSSLYEFVGTNENLRRRIFGTHPGRHSDDERMVLFLRRHLQTFNEPAEAQGFAAAAYDLAYQLHYAIAAVGEEPITGPNIGKAIQTRFRADGFHSKTWEAGAGIAKTYQAIQAGQNVFIDGATQPGLYDQTGQGLVEGQVWCIMKSTAKPELANRYADSGYFFTLDGTALQVHPKLGLNPDCL